MKITILILSFALSACVPVTRALTPLSPYRHALCPDGTRMLPNYNLWESTYDDQHLQRLGIGSWRGPRIEALAWPALPSYAATRLARKLGASKPAAIVLGVAPLAAYTLIRARALRYPLDPPAYVSGLSWGLAGAGLGAGLRSEAYYAPLTSAFIATYPLSTPAC